MQVIVYYRRNPDPAKAEAELAVQRRSVADWLTANDATMLAEETEDEISTRSRPAMVRARRLAKASGAAILVATDKAIGGGGRFGPSTAYYEIPYIISIEDPAAVFTRELRYSPRIVLYLRRPDHPDAEAFLAKQELGLQRLISPAHHTVLATFTEDEPAPSTDGWMSGPDIERPKLAAALTLCREGHAQLFVGTTDAVAVGWPFFTPRFTDIPHRVAYRQEDEEEPDVWPEMIDVPEALSAPVALHIGAGWKRNRHGLYLVNKTGDDLLDITVTRSGWTTMYGDLTVMNPYTRMLNRLAPDTGRLIGNHDVFFHCDFNIAWRVAATLPDGRRFGGGIDLPSGGMSNANLGLLNWAPVPEPAV